RGGDRQRQAAETHDQGRSDTHAGTPFPGSNPTQGASYPRLGRNPSISSDEWRLCLAVLRGPRGAAAKGRDPRADASRPAARPRRRGGPWGRTSTLPGIRPSATFPIIGTTRPVLATILRSATTSRRRSVPARGCDDIPSVR